MQNRTKVTLAPGVNELPQLYNASVLAGGGKAKLLGSAEPHLGTTPAEPRDPNASTVLIEMSWPDALRLAGEILKMAKSVGALPPEGGSGPDALH